MRLRNKILGLSVMFIGTIAIFLYLFFPYGFEKNVIAYSATTSSPDITLTIYHGNNQEIQSDQYGHYKINQDNVERSTLSQAIIVKIFGSSLGYNDICFQNINSTYYFLNYNTEVGMKLRFNFNDNPVDVDTGDTSCFSVFSNTDFLVVLNQGIFPDVMPDITMKNLYSDKNFQDFLNAHHMNSTDINLGQLMPRIYTEVYVQPSLITLIVAFVVIFVVWSGFVLWCLDIWKFIR